MRNFAKNVLTVACSLLLTLLAAEGVLRLFPVNEGLRVQPVNSDNPILHFEPNRTSTWSNFADFSMVNTVHSNNYGFLNDQNYTPDGKLPLIAIIGDSYIEAAMVPYGETVQGRLAANLAEQWRVYSFGSSGAPLSQYLAYAEYARDIFRPERMIVSIVGNDFDESLLEYNSSPGLHYYKESPDGKLSLVREDYHPSLIRRLVSHSALAMYLVTNAHIQRTLGALLPSDIDTQFVGQTSARADERRLTLSRQVVDAFLDDLPEYSGLSPDKIIFTVDAMRPHMYSNQAYEKAKGSYFDQMRTHFITEARNKGYDVIDLAPVFTEGYARNGRKFEFPRDGHWSGYGHGVVAGAIMGRGW